MKAGDLLTLQFLVVNENNAPLESAELLVEYPSGTRDPANLSQVLTRQRFPLGRLGPRATVNESIKAVIFGEKDTQAIIKLAVEYRIPNSSALFDKRAEFPVRFSFSPVTLNAVLPAELTPDRELDITLNLAANSGLDGDARVARR